GHVVEMYRLPPLTNQLTPSPTRLTPLEGPLVLGSYQNGAKSRPLYACALYGSLGPLPHANVDVYGWLSMAPPRGGIANSPCWNVFGVSFGPAIWMPGINQAKIGAAIRDAPVPTSLPQYQLSGSTWSW